MELKGRLNGRFKTARRVDAGAQDACDAAKNHGREVELDMGQAALVRFADHVRRRAQHALHERDDEAVADRHHEIGAPVAQGTIGNRDVAPDIGDQVGHQSRFGADIFDVDGDAGLAVEDIRQEFAVEMADIGADLGDRLAVGQPTRQFCEKGGVDGGCLLCCSFCHRHAALFSPPGFIISCSTASIDGRS